VARLIGIVLRKRALSSPHALACSLRHRERVLSNRAHPGAQACLPFDDEEQDGGDLAQPPALGEATLLDTAAEVELLRDALSKARLAAARWSKVAPLVRLLRRTREQVLVFTEYRDTLEAFVAALPGEVAVVELHGGLARRERVEAIDRFVSGHARVLVATDVAAEGLNLQRGCRLVVHLELPWSPTRITQRNGRVDRIGQQRQVHIWRLLGDRRHEARVVAALAARLERMREAGVNAVGFGDRNAGAPAASESPDAAARHQPDPRDLALAHDRQRVAHLVRACGRSGGAGVARRLDGLAWQWLRRPITGLGCGVILVCLTPAAMRGACPSLVALHISLRQWPTSPPRDWLPALAAHAACAVPRDRRLSDALSRRESQLLANALDEHARAAGRWQASLFERRAARLVAATRDRARDRIDAHRVRLQELEAGTAPAVPVVALLVR
jgi:hypothetical protein